MSTGPSQTSACTPPSACSQSASVASPWKASSRRPRAARTVAGSRSAVFAVRNSATAAILSLTGVVFDGDRDQWQPRARFLDPLTWSADGFRRAHTITAGVTVVQTTSVQRADPNSSAHLGKCPAQPCTRLQTLTSCLGPARTQGVGIRHGRATAPAIGARGTLEPPTSTAARRPDPRATRGPLPQREHRLGDLAGRRIGDRSGGLPEDEQPCPGDLARDRLAVADGEERVPAAVDDERGDLDLGQALAPAGCAVEPGKHHAQLVGHLDRG